MNRHGLTSPMQCVLCDRPLHDCTCKDLAERMRNATGPDGNIYARWCRRCDTHYTRCECEKPDWWIRENGELTRDINDVPPLTLLPPHDGAFKA